MSPDAGSARGIGAVVSATRRRMRLLAIVEAVVWGSAAAAISFAAGALMLVAVAAWRWRAATRAHAVGALERAQPDARNLYVTADEIDRGVLAAASSVRRRVFDDAAECATRLDVARAVPPTPVGRAVLVGAAAWAIVSAITLSRGANRDAASSAAPAGEPAAQLVAARPRITVSVEPPAYTGLQMSTFVDPEQVEAIEGAKLHVSIEASDARLRLEQDGAPQIVVQEGSGRFAARLQAAHTGYLAVTSGAGARRVLPIIVVPDQLPAVRLTAPGRDLVYARADSVRINFAARATDDLGLRSLTLRYTKVSGSGEQFEFNEGEIPLTVTRADAREWIGTASRALASLQLNEGDMLVYRAVAADGRPGDGSASSDAFFIELSRLGVAAGDAFTLPEEETRYALSQQMLIVKTERLHRRRATMPAEELAEAALNLAVEQRMIRAEFVFMLGGEVEDEEVEAQQSTELQEGRLQNRGQRDLRVATIAMSQAEKLLTGANTAEALVAERAAVAALQRAFARDRYILRALATRSQLDSARRLTGSLEQARDWRRARGEAATNRRAAVLQDLLRGLADLHAEPGTMDQRMRVLAEEAIRIDATSARLRQVATSLQRAAASGDEGARSAAIADAVTAAANEARRDHADPALTAPVVDPALNGAFADALSRRSIGSRRQK